MRIYGNFAVHDYLMQVNGLDVASVHKKWFAMQDHIGLSIIGEVDHRIVLGALIVIEHNEVTEQTSSQSSYWRQNSGGGGGGGWYYR